MKSVFFILNMLCVSTLFSQAQESISAKELHVNLVQDYNTTNGLPTDNVYHLMKDDQGKIWISTDRGISVFNGQDFSSYGFESGLSDYEIMSTYQDKNGTVWLATFNGQPCYYQDGSFHIPPIPDSIKMTSLIVQFIETKDMKIALSNRGKGLIWENHNLNSFLLDSNKYYSVFTEKYQDAEGLISVRSLEKNRDEIIIETPTAKTSYIGKYISVGHYDGKKSLILFKFDLDTEKITIEFFNTESLNKESSQTLEDLIGVFPVCIEKVDSLIYLGTRNGLLIYQIGEMNHLQLVGHYFENTTISSILFASDEMWLSTLESGIFRCNVSKVKNRVHEEEVFRIVESKGRIFTCGTGKFIEYLNSDSIIEYDLNGVVERVTDIEVLDEDKLLVSTGIGAVLWQKGLIYKYGFGGGLKDICRIKDTIFIGAYNGIYKIQISDLSYLKLMPDRITNIRANTITIHNEKLLFGNIGGLYSADFSGQSIQKFGSTKSRVNRIIPRSQKLWYCTASEGVFFHKESQVRNYLENKTVHELYERDGIVVAVLDNQLVFIENEHMVNYSFSSLNINGKVMDVYLDDVQLYLGTSEGLFVLQLDELNEKGKFRPQIFLNHIQSSGQIVQSEGDFDLDYDKNDVSVETELVYFGKSSSIQYHYSLINKNTDKTYLHITNAPTYSFYDLAYGNYELSIWAEVDEVKSNELIYRFKILKPFYKELWFALLIAIVSISIITLIIRNRFNSYKKEQKRLRELYEYEQQALRAKMNPHFLFNVLNSIQQFFLKDENLEGHRYLKKFAKLVRIVLNNTDKTYVHIVDELDYINRYVELEQLRSNVKFDFRIVLNIPDKKMDFLVPSMTIQPFVENSIWHAFDDTTEFPEIVLTATLIDKLLYINISDNGKGFLFNEIKEKKEQSHGLGIVKDRLEVLKKHGHQGLEFSIQSTLKKGTKVSILIPEKDERITSR